MPKFDFDEAVKGVDARPLPVITVDLSARLPGFPDLELKDITIAQVYSIRPMALLLLKDFPQVGISLADIIITIGLAAVAAGQDDSIYAFLGKMAISDIVPVKEAFSDLVEKFSAGFPHLMGSAAGAVEEKKSE